MRLTKHRKPILRKAFAHAIRRSFGLLLTAGLAVGLPVGFVGGTNLSLAAAPQVEAAKLPELARAATKQFQPTNEQQVRSARTAALAALRRLEGVLSRNPDAVREGWNKHLHLSDLRSHLEADPAPVAELDAAVARFSSDQAGLEWKHFLAVRDAVKEYSELAAVAGDAKAAETHASTLEELAKSLEAYAQAPTSETARAVGRGLGHLRRTRQAGDLVEAVDAHYTRPNFHLEASHKFMSAGTAQKVDQQTTVTDNVMGATIRSSVHLQGDVSMEFVPDANQASMRLLLAGTASSNSVGWKGPVTIYSTGLTSVSAAKDLRLVETGLEADPASANCSTSTQITGISAKCNMIRKMAWKKAGKSKGQAESIASQNAAARVAAQMDEESGELIGKTNESFQQKFRARLVRRGQTPRQMQFATTADRLSLTMLQSGGAHVAAPAAPPALAAARDVNIRLHESFVGNMSEAIVGGLTITDEKLAEMMQEMTGDVPEELKIGPDKDPWSITFAAEHPVAVTFTDKTLAITINGRRFTRGDREIRDAARIAAVYTIEKTPTGAKLTRQGDLEVDYVNIKGSQSVSQVAFRTFLRRKFESLLKAEIASDGLKLKGRWEKAGKLAVEDIQMSPGWIALGWNLASVDARTASAE